MEYNFTVGRHTEQAHNYTSALIDEAYKRKASDTPTTPHERVRAAERLCEAYYAQLDIQPPSAVLSRLAWYIVFDEMTDDHPDKMTREEYPIPSGKQLFRRHDWFALIEDIEYGDRSASGRKKTAYFDESGAPRVSTAKLPFPYDDEADPFLWRGLIESILDGAELSEKQRQTVVEIHLNGKTQAIVAAEMGVSRQMVQRHYSRAFDKMSAYVRKVGICNLL